MDGHQIDCGCNDRLQQVQGESSTGKDGAFTRTWDAAVGRTIDLRLQEDVYGTTPQLSPFLARLPLEIRFRIYSLVMPQHRRLWPHATPLTRDSSTCPCCLLPEDTAWMAYGSRCCMSTKHKFFEHVQAIGVRPHRDSLMRGCRQVYVFYPHVLCQIRLLTTQVPTKCVFARPVASTN